MQVACRKDLEFVKALTSYNVNCDDKYGCTPLHLACVESQLKVVQFLVLDRHCHQDIQNDRGELPLHIACSQVSLEPVISHYIFLGMAIQTLECVRLLPEVVPTKPATLPPELANLPLEFVKLVSTDCDINATTKIGGDTPVHIACRHSQIDIVTYLTQERHCALNIANNEGELPLHIACQQKLLEMVKLVDKCDINVTTKSGDTPVHIACRHYQIDIVTYLTQERHCDVNIPNNEGELPLHIACQWNSLEMVKLVSSCGLHAQTKRGYTAMHIACENNATGIIEHLVQEKSWKCKPKMYDDLLIHCARSKGSAELVRKLASPTNVNTRFP